MDREAGIRGVGMGVKRTGEEGTGPGEEGAEDGGR